MDILSDTLRQAGLKKRILGQRALPPDTALRFPCDKSIGFHVVTQGRVYIQPPGKAEAIVLEKGDVALMARGCEHVVSTEPKFAVRSVRDLGDVDGPASASKSSKELRATLVSGAYQFWNSPVHPFFQEVPDWFVLRSADFERLDELPLAIGMLAREVKSPELGSENIVNALLDVLFIYLIRRMVAAQGAKAKTWSHAASDPQIRRVVELMHEDCARDWTLVELARKAGLSRASLATKFRHSMGDTPLHYLRTIRIQKSMSLLSESQDNLETIAAAVGYGDAFGFSKVFKKTLGISPREFRAKDHADKTQAWRFS